MTTTNTDTTEEKLRERAPWGRVTVNDELDLRQVGTTQFAVLVFERGLAHMTQLKWKTGASSLDPVLPYAVATARSTSTRSAVVDLERVVGDACLASVSLSRETLRVRIAAAELPVLAHTQEWLRACFPPEDPPDPAAPRVPVSFWSYGGYASQVSRSISVPVWEEIAGNYPRAVRSGLERLSGGTFRPASGGQLVLWHGDPGTGKTYALRSLAWAWRDWCDLHYVTDPDTFFGSRADYMMEVLLEEGDEKPERWRLLVLEDTGDLLAADGGGGAGLSRLLNVVDGIVGQGLRILVLVTTNEPLMRLHPALSRPGRCAARIEFGPFEPDEAEAWLAARGGRPGAPSRATLARLYAHLRGDELPVVEQPRPRVGFVR